MKCGNKIHDIKNFGNITPVIVEDSEECGKAKINSPKREPRGQKMLITEIFVFEITIFYLLPAIYILFIIAYILAFAFI